MRIIGGIHRGKPLLGPKTEKTRPSSSLLREAVFNILQNKIEGASVLELFAGTGAIGLEALSRGANFVLFVEKERKNADLIKKNIAFLKEESRSSVLVADAFSAVKTLFRDKQTFDYIYADPPYGSQAHSFSNRLLLLLEDCDLLKRGGRILLEDAKGASFEPHSLRNLKLIDQRTFGRAVLRQYAASKSMR